ncbi:hypothetical protein [Enterovibrio norvegicus]|uniref:hypothetical protein n=1 Tax=Enterovibrio norvegicus TaxID=188144 RepID=UPI000308A7E0|nr:hypothetical protein [Enterovibrio norvegicus]OEF57929.1 hypothetical protein A1OU_06900 [Enterovibrio norvegicus]
MENPLTSLDQVLALSPETAFEAFQSKHSVEKVIETVRNEALSEVPDVETRKGRERIGSLARKVSESKTAVVKVIDSALVDAESQVKAVKATKKHVEEQFSGIRSAVLKPREEWQAIQEELERKRQEGFLTRIHNIKLLGETTGQETLSELNDLAEALDLMTIRQDDFAEFTGDALTAKENAVKKVNDAIVKYVELETQRQALHEQEVTNKINEIRLMPMQALEEPAGMVVELKETLSQLMLDKGFYGERLEEAISAKSEAIRQLDLLAQQKEELKDNARQEQAIETPDDMIEISLQEYKHLLERNSVLTALEQQGVDNWEGYSEAMSLIPDKAA